MLFRKNTLCKNSCGYILGNFGKNWATFISTSVYTEWNFNYFKFLTRLSVFSAAAAVELLRQRRLSGSGEKSLRTAIGPILSSIQASADDFAARVLRRLRRKFFCNFRNALRRDVVVVAAAVDDDDAVDGSRAVTGSNRCLETS